MFIPLVWC